MPHSPLNRLVPLSEEPEPEEIVREEETEPVEKGEEEAGGEERIRQDEVVKNADGEDKNGDVVMEDINRDDGSNHNYDQSRLPCGRDFSNPLMNDNPDIRTHAFVQKIVPTLNAWSAEKASTMPSTNLNLSTPSPQQAMERSSGSSDRGDASEEPKEESKRVEGKELDKEKVEEECDKKSVKSSGEIDSPNSKRRKLDANGETKPDGSIPLPRLVPHGSGGSGEFDLGDESEGSDEESRSHGGTVKKPLAPKNEATSSKSEEKSPNPPPHPDDMPKCYVSLTDIKHERQSIFKIDVLQMTADLWLVATGGSDSNVGIWYLRSDHKSELITYFKDHTREVRALCFGPSTTKVQLASGGNDKIVHISGPENSENFSKWKRMISIPLTDAITDLSWIQPKQLLIAANEPSLFFYNLENGTRTNVGEAKEYGMIKGAKVDPLNQFVAALAEQNDMPLKLWVWEQIDIVTGRERTKKWVPVYPTQKAYQQTSSESRNKGIVFARPSWDPLGSACCFPHGEYALERSQQKESKQQRLINDYNIIDKPQANFYKRCYAPLIGRGNWSDELAQFRGHTSPVTNVQFGPVCQYNGESFSLLATASQDGTVVLWKSNTKDALCVFTEVTDSSTVILDLAITPNGRSILVSTTKSCIVQLTLEWDFHVCTPMEINKILAEASTSVNYKQPLAIPSAPSSLRLSLKIPSRTPAVERATTTMKITKAPQPEPRSDGALTGSKIKDIFDKGTLQCPRGVSVYLGHLLSAVHTPEYFISVQASTGLLEIRTRKNGIPIIPPLLTPFTVERMKLCENNTVICLGVRLCIFTSPVGKFTEGFHLAMETDEVPLKPKEFGYVDNLIWIESSDGIVLVYLKTRGWIRMDTSDFSSSPFHIPVALSKKKATLAHPVRRGWIGPYNAHRGDYKQGVLDMEHRLISLRALKDERFKGEIDDFLLVLRQFYSELFDLHNHQASEKVPVHGCVACEAKLRINDLERGLLTVGDPGVHASSAR